MTEIGTAAKAGLEQKKPEPLAKATKLFNRNYLLLWQGQFVSRLGNQVYYLAMILWIQQSFPANVAPSYVGLLGMLAGIPAVLLSALGGAVADRYSRKKIIVLADFFNGITVLSLAAMFFLIPGKLNLLLIGVFTVNVMSGVLNSFFGPAISAAIPDIVPEKRVAGANTMGQLSMQMATFFGMGVGGILLRILGAPLLILIDGITYLISAFSESFIRIPQQVPDKVKTFSEVLRSFKHDIGEGLHYIFANKGLRNLLFVSVFSAFFSAPITILLVFFVEHRLGVNPELWFGPLLVAFSIGTLIGYLSVGLFRIRGEVRKRLMIIFMILNSTGYILLGLATTPALTIVLIFIGGVLSGFVVVNITTLLQITTPSHIRGRVFGALTTISGSITPLGMGLSGPVASLVGLPNIHWVYIGSGAIMVFLSLIISANRHFRKFIAYKTKDEPEEQTGFHYKIRVFDPNKIYANNQ